MRPLQRFERRLEGIVSGVFARAFKGDVEPIELAAALKREIDNTARILSRDRRLVPNHFTIELGPDDYERLNAYGRTLNHELANELRDHADIQRYTFSGPIDIELVQQDDLPTGKFRVVSETAGTPQRRPAEYQQPEPQPYQQEPYVPPNPPPVAPQYQQPPQPPQQQTPRRGHPQVMLEVNGRRRPVNPPGVVLGRGTDADIQINDPGVSRRHAEIRLMPEGPGGIRVVLVDLGSTNGTLVNGRRSTEAELVDGSTVRIGNTTMTLRLADEPMAQPPSSGW
ncbi:FhaA domain-containing protein [Kribbella sp. NPDC059898]|uniref:FhaA domain-containing protein n=1 Tax=Kribbella sp. NPDC059898 TaxID=3346995 RepID=UPI003655619E